MKYVLTCSYKSPQSGLFVLSKKSDNTQKQKQKMNILKQKNNIFLYIGLIIILIGIFLSITPVFSSAPNILDTKINSTDLITLTNEIRAIKNLNPLTVNDRLTLAAANKAKHLIKHNYFSHNSPAGKQFSEWIIESGYEFKIVGENLAIGFDNNKDVMKAWMDSPTHRQNILNEKYKEIGLVVMQGNINGQMQTIVVQIFGAQPILKISENLSEYQNKIYPFLDNAYS